MQAMASGLSRAGLCEALKGIPSGLRPVVNKRTGVPFKASHNPALVSSVWARHGARSRCREGERQLSGPAKRRAFFASPGKTVDPAPSPSRPAPQGLLQQMRGKLQTQVAFYRMRNSVPPLAWSPEAFPTDAAEMYRDFMAALNVGDRSTLRELLTERMFSRFKAHLPDKKERRKQAAATSAVAFVTGNASIVQARAAQITGPIDTIFVQVTCDIQVLQPERSLVRVVFEHPLGADEGRWRICDLIL